MKPRNLYIDENLEGQIITLFYLDEKPLVRALVICREATPMSYIDGDHPTSRYIIQVVAALDNAIWEFSRQGETLTYHGHTPEDEPIYNASYYIERTHLGIKGYDQYKHQLRQAGL